MSCGEVEDHDSGKCENRLDQKASSESSLFLGDSKNPNPQTPFTPFPIRKVISVDPKAPVLNAPDLGKIKNSDLPRILEEIRSTIKKKGKLANIKNTQDPNFYNTIEPLEYIVLLAELPYLYADVLSSVRQDNEFEFDIFLKQQSQYLDEIFTDRELFEKVQSVYKRQVLSEYGGQILSESEQFVVTQLYMRFKAKGVGLSPESQEKLKEIGGDIGALGASFESRQGEDIQKYFLLLDENELDGLPKRVRDNAKKEAENRGYKDKWLITLSLSEFIDFMEFSENRMLRKKIFLARSSIGFKNKEFDNTQNVFHMVRLRVEQAKLSGYSNFSEYNLPFSTVLKTPQKVFDFLNQLLESIKPRAEKDLQEVKDYAAKNNGPLKEDFQPWDERLWRRKLKESTFKIDKEEITKYFEFGRVLEKTFEIISLIFGLEFRRNEKIPVYHSDVLAYEVFDTTTKKRLSVLYLDPFSRAGKNPNKMFSVPLQPHHLDENGNYQELYSFVFFNFKKGSPSLLKFEEVIIVFHEMGHEIHKILSTATKYNILNSEKSPIDVAEFPSMLFENFASHPKIIKILAQHYETQKQLPEDSIKKLSALSKFQESLQHLRTISLSLLDMAWHSQAFMPNIQVQDISQFVYNFELEARQSSQLYPPQEGTIISTSFPHLFGSNPQYASAYYSYLLGEVLAKNVFIHLQSTSNQANGGDIIEEALNGKLSLTSQGILSQLKSILSMGANLDNVIPLITDFLGHEIDYSVLSRTKDF